ncbi:MAG TPA: carboxypeptidase-like regulatory domain-containing protein [Terriglobia bacterium]|nr:carboxypeptidase-like regulatory domain-containing protein [Terriglobia bacterium]
MKRTLILLATVLLSVCVSGFAQDTARMVGTVTDKSGAVIPNAKVTVSNPDKAYTRVLTTDSAGFYSVQAIPIGDYVVTAEATGFQKLVRSGISLNVGQVQQVNFELTVGQVTQEVTVSGNVPKVQTETAAVSSVITNQQIQNLDLNGRNWVTLALLVPGASPDNGLDAVHVGVAGNNNISFNGNRMQYNNWEIDGGNNTDEGSASTFNTYPSLDTIAEFRISTSNYGADMGKHAGANIELATKSGTKDFHGSAFEYNRNGVFDANNFFTNRASIGATAPKEILNWNDFGYTIGGPVFIPGHYNTDKSKTFFFWSEDWRRYRNGNIVSAGVPTPLERQGDFSQEHWAGETGPNDPGSSNYNSVVATGAQIPALTAAGTPCNRGASVYENQDGTLNANYNAAQANCIFYDTAQSMPGFNQTAFANGTDLLNGLVPLPNSGVNGWESNSSAPTNWRQEQIRIDQNISDKTQAFFRYTQDTWNTVSVPSLWQWASYDTIKTNFGGPGESAVLHITHTFKPTLENEFVAAYTTDHILLYPVSGNDSPTASLDRPSDFQMAHLFASNAGNTMLPSLELCGGQSFCTNEEAGNFPWFNSNPIITWKDNLAWVHGNQTTKVGFYLENYRKNEQFGTDTQGQLFFGGGGSLTSGNAMADMFLGNIQQYTEGTQIVNGTAVGGYAKGHWQMTDLEPYFQDDWKVTPHLTLNLGVRYYIYTRIHDVTRPTIDSGFLPNQYQRSAEAQLDSGGNYVPGTGFTPAQYGNGLVQCGHNGIPLGCQLQNTGKNIAPRFGFAWDPFGKGTTSVRGGFGLYFESGNGNEAQTEGGEGNPPGAPGVSVFNVSGYGALVPGALLIPAPPGFTGTPYSEAWPSVQQYNLSVEHEFTGNTLVSVAYVGALGRHLARAQDINQVDPAQVANGGTINVPEFAGKTFAHGSCDAAGNCDAQNIMIYNEEPALFFRPYQGYGQITYKQNTAVSSYNALQASVRHSMSHGLTLQMAYTWAHAIDNSSSTYIQTSGAIDDYNLSRWKATSDLNRAQVLQINYIYAIPFFKNSSSAIARQALGGWQLSGITSLFTGEPVDFNCGISGYSTGLGGTTRCDVVGNVAIDKGMHNDPTYGPTATWWNPATVAQPLLSQLYANGEPSMFGNMGRNTLTGPGRNNTDLALEKNFSLPWFNGEHSTLQFRLETFNTFNHTQWNGFNTGCSGSNTFGETCDNNTTSPGEVNSAWAPRQMQLGLRFNF